MNHLQKAGKVLGSWITGIGAREMKAQVDAEVRTSPLLKAAQKCTVEIQCELDGLSTHPANLGSTYITDSLWSYNSIPFFLVIYSPSKQGSSECL
jgi:hypothetical protein